MDKKLQNVTFQPSTHQLKFAEIYLDYTQKKTYEEIGKEINVTRMTIWRWFQNEDFVDWINEQARNLLAQSLSDRLKVAIRQAKAGDFSFSKLLFEMEGEYTPSRKIEAEIIDKTEQELERRFDEKLEQDPDFKKRVLELYEETECILKEASGEE